MKNYIYILRDPNDGNVVYVGKTKNPKNRKSDHFRKCKGRYRSLLDKWKNQILESGKLPIMEIIKECDIVDVNFWEKHYISEYRSLYNILNMTDGGDGLQNPNDEVRKKIGQKSKGRRLDEDTRRKISEKNYNNTGNRIVCYDKDKNLVGYYRNSRRASEILKIGYKNISKILNGKEYFIKGYTFFLEGEDEIEKKIEERLSNTIEFSKKFYRISKNGDIKEYDNLIKASLDNNCNYKNIWLCLNNQRKTCNGFAWSYESIFDSKYFKKNTNAKKCRLKRFDEIILFESLEEAVKFTGLSKSTICNYLKNKIKPLNGDIWDYV